MMKEVQLGANVLLVGEDLPEVESCLEESGGQYEIVRVDSELEVLQLVKDTNFALILLNLTLKDKVVIKLAELIRKQKRSKHTPIIFISETDADNQCIFKGNSHGAVDYIKKPLNPDVLRSKVQFFTEFFHRNQESSRRSDVLEKSNLKLEGIKEELESRVRLRTEELEIANRELQAEIEYRKQSETRLIIEHSITRALADFENLEGAPSLILRTLCENTVADVCAFWILDESGSQLRCSQIEVADGSAGLETFLAEIGKTDFPKGMGVPGHVWKVNSPVWLGNGSSGPKIPRSKFAAAVGLTEVMAFPISIGKEFYGAIEIFSRSKLDIDPAFLEMLNAIGSEIGQYFHRKRVEEEKEALLVREKSLRERAEEAGRLKDEFLSIVSHELRTPLNAILGWSQIMQEGKLSIEAQAEAIRKIYRNARSQAELIEDLLDTSNLIAGKLRLNLTTIPVKPIIEAAVDSVRPIAAAKDIELRILSEKYPGEIIGDSKRLQQVMWNLLSNAVKFTPKHGRVDISMEDIDEALNITVSDTGNGIPPDFLPYIFDRFRQADSSSIREYDGLGLGLAIVRHLTELHGGSVLATSVFPNGGSIFTISLPRFTNGLQSH